MSQTPLTSNKHELIARLIPFLQEVKDMTTSTEVEQWLNTEHGVESELYKDLATWNPWLEFQVYPVLDILEATPITSEALAIAKSVV